MPENKIMYNRLCYIGLELIWRILVLKRKNQKFERVLLKKGLMVGISPT